MVSTEVIVKMVCVLTEEELDSIYELASRLEEKGLLAESNRLRSIVTASTGRSELKASDAAAILHVTPQTVRNWVRRGLLEGRLDQTGHVLVAVSALKSVLDMDAAMPYRPENAPDVTDDEILAEIAAYRAERTGS